MSDYQDSKIEGGLFSHYDAALDAGQPALKIVAGTPAKQMQEPMRARDCGHVQAIAAAAVAAGTVRLLGAAVETYNRGVDELNARWRAAKAQSFGGVAPESPAGGASEDQIRQASVRHADQLLDAKLELLSCLEHEHGTIRRELDEAIATATERLSAGPTAKVLRELFEAGGLPPSVLRSATEHRGTLATG
jgi:hypothetical protein